MTSNDFDISDCRNDFLVTLGKDPKKFRDPEIKELFALLVKNEQDWVKVKDQAERVKVDGRNIRDVKAFIKSLIFDLRTSALNENEDTEPVEETPIAPIAPVPRFAPGSDDEIRAELDGNTLYPISVPNQQVKEALLRIWDTWPKNLEYPERKGDAYTAMKAAAKIIPLDDIEAVCAFYTDTFNDPSSGLVSPYHLKTFVSREELFSEWKLRARTMPKSEDLDIFNATWAWYPEFQNREVSKTVKDSQSFWFRHVLPEDRWRFLSAVKQLRDSKRDLYFIDREDKATIEKYTPSMVSFIGAWRETKYFRMMARDMSSGSYPVLRDGNFFDTPDLYHLSVGLEQSYYGKLMIRHAGCPRATFVDVLQYIRKEHLRFKNKPKRPEFENDETLAAFADVLYNAGWEFALKPPKVIKKK